MASSHSRRKSLSVIAGGAVVVFIFGAIGYLLSFFSNILAARLFSPHDFGLFTIAQTVLGIAALFAVIGIPAGITRFIPYYQAKKNGRLLAGYSRFMLVAPLTLAMLIGTALFVWRAPLATAIGIDGAGTVLLTLVAIMLPFRVLSDVLGVVFVAHKSILYDLVRYHVVEKTLFLVLLVGIALTRPTASWLVAVFGISIVCSFLYALIYTRKMPWRFSQPAYDVKTWLSFSLPLLFSSLFGLIIAWSDKIIIARMMDPTSVGIYSVALSFAALLGFFQAAFAALFIPVIAEHHGRKERAHITFLFKKAAAWVFGATIPVFLLIALFGKQLITLFYGDAYAGGYAALLVLAIGFLINISTGLNKEILIVHGRTKFLLITSVILATLNIVGNIALVPRYGILGAAMASCAVMILDNVICFIAASQNERLVFDGRLTLKFLFAALLALGCAGMVFSLTPWLYVNLGVAGLVYGCMFVFFVFVFKSISQDEIRVIEDFEKRLGIKVPWLHSVLGKAVNKRT